MLKVLSEKTIGKPKAVIFDTDNTLYPYDTAHVAAIKAVFEKAEKMLGIDKKEFKNLSFKIEKLKTLIHKAGLWDSFAKTNEFKTLNKMNLIIRKHITQQRRN